MIPAGAVLLGAIAPGIVPHCQAKCDSWTWTDNIKEPHFPHLDVGHWSQAWGRDSLRNVVVRPKGPGWAQPRQTTWTHPPVRGALWNTWDTQKFYMYLSDLVCWGKTVTILSILRSEDSPKQWHFLSCCVHQSTFGH